ncbi:DUF6124 family protein [Pseudomonas sp. Z18(2022)]|uniref:DUF6124 family protein n=1 Tax=Pseudomonas sp. Z18(2022) TaxID=2983410 RepID=UPI003FA6C6AE
MSFGISARMRRTAGLFKAGMRSVASADARGPYPGIPDSFLGLSLRRWLPTLRWSLQTQRPGFAMNLPFEIDGAPRSVALGICRMLEGIQLLVDRALDRCEAPVQR